MIGLSVITLAILVVMIGAGLLVTSLQVWLTNRYAGRKACPFTNRDLAGGEWRLEVRPASKSDRPQVSILKPLCGLDDDLRRNLLSFVALSGVTYEVILTIADKNDPAVEVVLDVMRDYPNAPFRLVIGDGDPRVRNPKVERLIAAEPLARGEIVMVSDSNIRLEQDDLRETVLAFSRPGVGCVTNLFVGRGGRDIGASIEMLHLLSFVLAGNVLAKAFGKVCVVGKSMSLRRDVLEQLGGFRRFSDVLAEDQAIGLAVRELGFEIAIAPVRVTNVIESRTVGRAMARQVRWNKIRFSFSPWLYTGELLLMPFPLSMLAVAVSALSGSSFLPVFLCLNALVAATRALQIEILHESTGAERPAWSSALILLLDVLQFGAHWVPYMSRTVIWRGNRARIGRGTMIVPVGE